GAWRSESRRRLVLCENLSVGEGSQEKRNYPGTSGNTEALPKVTGNANIVKASIHEWWCGYLRTKTARRESLNPRRSLHSFWLRGFCLCVAALETLCDFGTSVNCEL